MKKPNSRRNLDLSIERVFGRGQGFIQARAIIANVIIGQMLPDGVVKGGSSIKFRLGDEKTRYTTDLDVARATNLESYISQLSSSLEKGWEGFTGYVSPRKPATPKGVPATYVMQPFGIKLNYNNRPWVTVDLEVGHDEIGDADEPEFNLPEFVVTMFESIGLPKPNPIPLMPIPYQIAQKLHGLSEPGSMRVHDLIDIQLIVAGCDIDLGEVHCVCERLFAYRSLQKWPSFIDSSFEWNELYYEQSLGLNVLSDLDLAVAWVNDLIKRIDNT